jgi:CRISPR-associated protein Csb2
MLLIQARFLSGRFHATPWGHHVNEGLVEWPPSPWRLLRALLSAGFTRLGWMAPPPEGVAGLIELFARRPPRYHLPAATTAHTRHYMPLYAGKTTRVIDAFASVAGPLVIEFDVDLDPEALSLLDGILASVPYLGRAESTVELTRIDAVPDGYAACMHGDAAPTADHERIALLAPEEPTSFLAWREAAVRDALTSLSSRASAKGKGASKKEIAKVEASLPRTLVEVLLVTTPDLQREGWSQPPGARWLSYWRPRGALEARPRAASPAPRRQARTDTALFALSSDTARVDVLPAMRDALYRMEALHEALVLKSAHRSGGPSPCFTGSVNGDRIPGHRHATLIPLTLGRRQGRIDHVLVHAPMGFDSNPGDGALHALGAIRRIWTKNLPDVFIVLAGTGLLSDFDKAVPIVRRSTTFRSWTPFVPPRHPKEKGKDTLLGQVQAELATRGMPVASRVELELGERQWAVLDERSASVRGWPRFRGYARRRASRPPPVDLGLSLRLVFDCEVRGPISLGYGSHFGLGAFEPCE